MLLKQSTAVDVLIGPFVDSTDGYTPETGVSPAVKLSKNGQTLGAKSDATTPVHDADGYYNCELDATDTNTVGTLVVSVVGSATSLAVRHEFQVVEEAVYDALYASGAVGPLEANDTGTGLSAVPWNASWDAEVQSECNDALVAQKLDHLVAVADNNDPVDDSIIAKIAGAGGVWSSFDGFGYDLTSASAYYQGTYNRIGPRPWPTRLADTTIAGVTSQTQFTLSTASPDDDAYNGFCISITDQSTGTQKAIGHISDYVGATKEVTLSADPGIFTFAVGDFAAVLTTSPAIHVVNEWETQSQADPTGFHVNVMEVGGTPQTANDNGADINAILLDTNELQGDWANGGRLDLILDAILADTNELQGDDVPGLIAALNDPTAVEVADAILKRDWNSVSGEAARSALNALRFLRNKWSISGTTLTVTQEDDSTAAWTGTVSTDASADPVIGNDPA